MQYMSKSEAVNSGMLDKSFLSEDENYEEEQNYENKIAFFIPEVNCHMVVDNSLYEDIRAVSKVVKEHIIVW